MRALYLVKYTHTLEMKAEIFLRFFLISSRIRFVYSFIFFFLFMSFNLTQFSNGVIFLFVIVCMFTSISPTHNMVCVCDTIREIAPRLDKLTNKYFSLFRIADKRIEKKNRPNNNNGRWSLSISNFNFQSVLKKCCVCSSDRELQSETATREKKNNKFVCFESLTWFCQIWQSHFLHKNAPTVIFAVV